jgi:tetratricopeptide (TPR) repeat protein
MDTQQQFELATSLAERGDFAAAARTYREMLQALQASGVRDADQPQLIRSIAFNLSQALNRAGEHAAALAAVERGIALAPSAFGMAIALSAKGEALAALGRVEEGKLAFEQAAQSHPVVGRLNAADSMSRLDAREFWDLAEQRVKTVMASFSHLLTDDLRTEADKVMGKVALRRGEFDKARTAFTAALARHPNDQEAQRLLQELSTAAKVPPKGLFAKLFGSK